jgi:hypothetical protein
LNYKRAFPPTSAVLSEEEIDGRVQDIIDAITKAIELSTPKAQPSSKSIARWT